MNPEKMQRVVDEVPVEGQAANSLLGSHFGNTDYLLTTEEPKSGVMAPGYEHNELVWQSLNRYELNAGMPIVLKEFMVFDWFPRSPGLYHTEKALFARQSAYYHRLRGFQSPIRDHAGLHSSRPSDYTEVFSHQGKMSMLNGGIGAIRLKPIKMFDEPHWLMTASSDGITHTGIPLAVPVRLYGPLLPTIHADGAVCAVVTGEIQFAPNTISRLFDRAQMVQKILVRVTNIELCERKPVQLETSVAVSFVSDFQGYPNVYASYVTFEPDVQGSFEDAIDWMKKEYVEGLYGGRIVTDFDQTRTIFPEARLALSRVMDRLISRGELSDTIELMHARGDVESYFDRIARRELLPKKSLAQRKNIFISYAHAAEKQTGWVDRIKTHLRGLTQSTDFEVWTDADIESGRRWQEEIQQAIDRSRVAILILTADFLASPFIRDAELPPLLEAAEADGITILCLYGSEVHLSSGVAQRLSRYEGVNKPTEPLQSLSDTDRESVYTKLTRSIERALFK